MISTKPFNSAGIRRGIVGKTEFAFSDGFTVEIRINTGDGTELRLKHYTNDTEEEPIEYCVPQIWTVPPFGGLRWWFLCPNTRRQCVKLYLPNGGRRFLSRKAYRLRYACQVESPTDRAYRRARKLGRDIGGGGTGIDFEPERPKGMWRRTFERKVAVSSDAAENADAHFAAPTNRTPTSRAGR